MTFIPRNILIFEAYTDANIGSGALVENTVKLLKAKYPGCRIRIMAHYPEAFHYEGVESVPDAYDFPYRKPRWVQVLWLSKTLLWLTLAFLQAFFLKSAPFPLFREKVRHFQWADLAVSVGAERLNDKFVSSLFFSALNLRLLKALGKRVVFFPSTVGPFLHAPTRALAAGALRRLNLVYTRDRQSTKACLEELKLDPERVIETSDVAVCQAQEKPEKSWALLSSFRGRTLAPDTPLVGISALKWTYRASKATPFSNYPSYLQETAKLADQLVERHGIQIAFFPTNYPVHGCREDDVEVCREVMEKMKHPEAAFIIDRLTPPGEFKGLLSCMRVNIVTRMHACILSTGAGIPTLSINYLFKLKEYMESLGLAEFAVDIDEFHAEALLPAFEKMWNDRDHWAGVIRKAIDGKKESLDQALQKMDLFLS